MANPKKTPNSELPDDETGSKVPAKGAAVDDEFEVEIEDDTPEEDRGREPMPKEIVDAVDAEDELEEYTAEKVKERLKQSKKIYHDERRAKEKEQREKAEAVAFAQRVLADNERLRNQYSQGEQLFQQQQRQLAQSEAAIAEREYREAYESGDTDKMVEAQNKLTDARWRLSQAGGPLPSDASGNFNYQPPLQAQPQQVSNYAQTPQAPQVDPRAVTWQERNTWFGSDPEMTSMALGLHQKLITERGAQFAQSDEYYKTIDETMRRRFPEYFEGEEEPSGEQNSQPRTPKANVVAPQSRGRSPKRIKLTRSQVELAGKLGLTPQQYAAELAKLEG